MIQLLALLQELQAPLQAPLQEPETTSAAVAATADAGLATVDQVGLGLLALFSLLGIWRGLWWQVMRLLGLAAAVMLARALSPKFGPLIERVVDLSSSVAQGIAWVVLFVGAITLAALIGRLGKKSLDAMQLGLMDRMGGLLAGVATGLVLFTSALVGVQYFAPEWTSAQLAETHSGELLKLVSKTKPILMDPPAAERFQQFVDTAPPRPRPEPEPEAPPESAPDGGGPRVH